MNRHHELDGAARQILDGAKGEMLTIATMDVETGQLPDQTDRVLTNCHKCNKIVQSTVFKQMLLAIAEERKNPVQLLCPGCLVAFVRDEAMRYDS
jgi:hypothetical protein